MFTTTIVSQGLGPKQLWILKIFQHIMHRTDHPSEKSWVAIIKASYDQPSMNDTADNADAPTANLTESTAKATVALRTVRMARHEFTVLLTLIALKRTYDPT